MTDKEPTAEEKAKAAAELAKAQADADLARLNVEQKRLDLEDSRRSRWTSLVPNLSDVPRGETKVSGDQPILGGGLAVKGLESAAKQVAEAVATEAATAQTILVTNEADLATVDAAYLTVRDSLEELHEAAKVLLEEFKKRNLETAGAATAVADLIPSVLGMLSAQRSVSTFATSVDDLSAVANVIGALLASKRNYTVLHNNFRLRWKGKIDDRLAELSTRRWELVKAEKEYAAEAVAAKEQIKTLVAAIDQFTTSVRAAPSGSTRSPLTNAVLYEQLHDKTIDHVLLVKGIAGSATQVLSDRPLWWKDTFSVVATANITYLLLNTVSNRIVSGGTKSATVSVYGKIGSKLAAEFG